MQHQSYSLQKVAEVVNGQLQGGAPERKVCDLLIDSRHLMDPAQALFFALKSSRNDGHRYIADLYDKGVRAFVVSHKPEADYPGAVFIVVSDTLKALQALAAYHRRQFDIPVIGITGSNGKTIVKEWLYQIFSPDYSIVRSPKSYNSQVGVPLSVWQMSANYDLAIFEAGISEPDEMMALQDIIRPNIGVFTNIGQAHDENFINRAQKAGEKLNLFTKAEQLVYCMDYSEIQQVVIRSGMSSKVKLFTWSRKFDEADLFVKQVNKRGKTASIECVYQGNTMEFVIPFGDDASVENAVHCVAVGRLMGLQPATLAERLKTLASIAMRLEIKAGVNNCTIINDYYNSDVNSLAIALDVMKQQRQHRQRTVILSDILQSGRNYYSYQQLMFHFHQHKLLLVVYHSLVQGCCHLQQHLMM